MRFKINDVVYRQSRILDIIQILSYTDTDVYILQVSDYGDKYWPKGKLGEISHSFLNNYILLTDELKVSAL